MTTRGTVVFGAVLATALATTGAASAARNARCELFDAPASVETGEAFAVRVRMRNNGNVPWDQRGAAVDALSTLPLGSPRWYLPLRPEWHSKKPRVSPGDAATFSFAVGAPLDPGTYSFDWSMTRAGIPFGQPCRHQIQVTKAQPPAPVVCPVPRADPTSLLLDLDSRPPHDELAPLVWPTLRDTRGQRSSGVGRGGSAAFAIGGDRSADGNARAHYILYDLDRAVTTRTVLEYWVKPLNERGKSVAVDLLFRDGAYMSGLYTDDWVRDQFGAHIHPAGQRNDSQLVVGDWNRIVVRLGDYAAGRTIAKVMVAFEYYQDPGRFDALFDDIRLFEDGVDNPPVAPVRFASDALVLTPGTPAKVRFVDLQGNPLPPERAAFSVRSYNGRTRVASDGTVVWEGSDETRVWYRVDIRATYDGLPVPGSVLVVYYPTAGARSVFSSGHWRLLLPRPWIDRARRRWAGDFGKVLDRGWETVASLHGGWTLGTTHIEFSRGQEGQTFEAMAQDDAACAYNGLPMGIGEGCFFRLGAPFAHAYFHEMGHNQQSLYGRNMWGEIYYNFGAAYHGEVTLYGDVVFHNLLAAGDLRPQTQRDLREQLRHAATYGLTLALWHEEGWWPYTAGKDPPVIPSLGRPLFEQAYKDISYGLYHRIARDYGWDFMCRLPRGWDNDETLRVLFWGTNRPHLFGLSTTGPPWYETTTLVQHNTYIAALVSAAVGEDLRHRFRQDWRFEIDDALFDPLHAYLYERMREGGDA